MFLQSLPIDKWKDSKVKNRQHDNFLSTKPRSNQLIRTTLTFLGLKAIHVIQLDQSHINKLFHSTQTLPWLKLIL